MPKGNSGIKRGGGSTGATEQKSTVQTTEISRSSLNASDYNAIERLREMASRGEIPNVIEGTREDRERIFEEFNRLYPDPPGILNDYTLDTSRGDKQVGIFFRHDMAYAESPQFIDYSRRNKTSEAGKAGQIKYEIYKARPGVEIALSTRSGGFSTFDMARKWGGRVLSNTEKAQVDREMEEHIQQLLGTPMSKEGRKTNETFWVKNGDGWERAK